MSKKKREYQKRKERMEKVKNIFSVFAILFVTLSLALLIVENAVVLRNIRQNTLDEYTGTYSYELKRSYGKHRRYYYTFTLGNGDVLSISKSKCDNEYVLTENQILKFQYSREARDRIFSPAFMVLSIESADGNVTLVSLESSQKVCASTIWACSICLVIWVCMFVGLSGLYYFVTIHDKLVRKRKKKNKIRNQT